MNVNLPSFAGWLIVVILVLVLLYLVGIRVHVG